MRASTRVDPRPQLSGVVLLLCLLPLSCKTTPTVDGGAPGPGRDGFEAYQTKALDKVPKPINCMDEPRPLKGIADDWLNFVRVTLRFVVDENGQVDPATITRMPSRYTNKGSPPEASMREAELRASSCRYEPGRIGEEAVRSVVMRTFEVPVRT